MLRNLCKQTCLALLDNACVFHLQINFWLSHRGYEGFRGKKYFFSYIILPHFRTKNMYDISDFSCFYK